MGAAVVPVLLVLVVLVVGAIALTSMSRRQRERVDETHRSDVGRLRYLVPEGQDSVPIVTALQREGYDAVAEGQEVVVPVRTDPERERARVRAVIAAAPVNMEGDRAPEHEVRFTDE